MQKRSEIKKILEQTKSELLKKENVVAVGIGYKSVNGKKTKELSIVCSVSQKKLKRALSKKDIIPSSIQGIITDVCQTGLIHALNTGYFRPMPGGVSIGHFRITAGSSGCLVSKKVLHCLHYDDKLFILSNNHVLANSNDANLGDSILQPGPIDGGRDRDKIAKLYDFIPIRFTEEEGKCRFSNSIIKPINKLISILGSKARLKIISENKETNLVDCAIAEPFNPADVTEEIFEIGVPIGTTEGKLGLKIQKSGRTTGLTTGTILQTNVTATVGYGGNKTAVFTDQLMAGAMSAGGDSGSVVLNNDKRIIGLLFAGSETVTLMNRIQNVTSKLNVKIP